MTKLIISFMENTVFAAICFAAAFCGLTFGAMIGGLSICSINPDLPISIRTVGFWRSGGGFGLHLQENQKLDTFCRLLPRLF